jgi:DNA-directed RNA polymerase specialized sigma24 family protein
MIVKARKAARCMHRRHYGDDRYEVSDMIQDGCLAELQGRSAWYGVCDGLRSWLGRHGRLTTVPLNERIDTPYYYPDPLRHLIACERLDWHLAQLDKLQPKYRCAYMLRHHEGKTINVTAQILGVHPQYVVDIVAKTKTIVER